MGEKGSSPVGVGVISIITILLVLCLTIFSALTLSSARADMALSQKNADTVAAYYAAEIEATALYQRFAAGTEQTAEATIFMTENQSLYVQLLRNVDGSVRVQAWRTQAEQSDAEFDNTLPVWDGERPNG